MRYHVREVGCPLGLKAWGHNSQNLGLNILDYKHYYQNHLMEIMGFKSLLELYR